MDASGLKWPSRVRLYCVNMSTCTGNLVISVITRSFMYTATTGCESETGQSDFHVEGT